MSYEDKKKASFERFERKQLDEKSIRESKSLEEINASMKSDFSSIESAKRNKDMMLQSIDEYSADINIHHRDIQFSDSTEAHVTTISIDYKNPRNSSDNKAAIISDIEKTLLKSNIDINKDIRYHFNVDFKNVKQRQDTGIVTNKFKSISDFIIQATGEVTSILDEYGNLDVSGAEFEITELS